MLRSFSFLVLLFPCLVIAAEIDVTKLPPPAAGSVDFARDIAPLLAERCAKCHGAEKQKGGFRVDVKAAALNEGDNYAPNIRPGRSAESPLIHFVGGLDPDMKMPAKGDPLTAEQVGLLRAWIDQGAEWPEDGIKDPRKTHWAFQPLHRSTIATKPAEGTPKSGNAIDAFIAAGLAAKELTMAPEADRRVLIRRLSLDLRGLPPTPQEVESFVADPDVTAYGTLVDRMLASPRYGERWARHWLDVVRFAESDGFETNRPRPNAWRYRDYVIRAFNEDRPYDQFIREQLAGDALGADEATGFIVGGSWDRVKSPDPVLTAQQRADELHDMAGTTGSAFLGLTVNCARCHNHKFDPISQSDYFAMVACFAGVQHGDRVLPRPGPDPRRPEADSLRRQLVEVDAALASFAPIAQPDAIEPRRVAVNPRRNIERIEPMPVRHVRFTIAETNNGSEPCLDELELWTDDGRNVAAKARATSSGDYGGDPQHRLEHLHDERLGNGRSWISNSAGRGWATLELPESERITRIIWGRDREGKFKDRLAVRYAIEVSEHGADWRAVANSNDRAVFRTEAEAGPDWDGPALTQEQRTRVRELDRERRELESKLVALTAEPLAYAGKFSSPPPIHRHHRGDPMQPKEVVAPGGLAEFGGSFSLSADASEQQRRLALANWIADPNNPLTARVLVNRLWHYHFGVGLVETPSDFGLNGARPTHPELLDWLAGEFVARGWSIKTMHRLIVNSAAYRQSSALEPRAATLDAGNRLLWRHSPRRMEAEALRDTILAVSGRLELRLGGPGFDLFEPNNNYVKVYTTKTAFVPDDFRRMIYQNKPRAELDTLFGAFDCPDAGQIQPKRNVSTTPLQALNLLNSAFLLEQANFLAGRLQREAGSEPRAQIQRGFHLAFGRAPSSEEVHAAEKLITAEGLPIFCRALYNANEFITID